MGAELSPVHSGDPVHLSPGIRGPALDVLVGCLSIEHGITKCDHMYPVQLLIFVGAVTHGKGVFPGSTQELVHLVGSTPGELAAVRVGPCITQSFGSNDRTGCDTGAQKCRSKGR